MLRIRLKRVGRKHDPSYRIVVTERERGPKSGTYIEKVGFYDPRSDTRQIDTERVKYWLSVGAQPSGTVHNIFVTEKVIDAPKVAVSKRISGIKEKTEEETPVPDQAVPTPQVKEPTDKEGVEEHSSDEISTKAVEEKVEEKIETPEVEAPIKESLAEEKKE